MITTPRLTNYLICYVPFYDGFCNTYAESLSISIYAVKASDAEAYYSLVSEKGYSPLAI